MRNKLYYENRIKLLSSRTAKDNSNIIKKLRRKLRSLER
nr:MAG TPA: hypothetical protein [Caudoviricetes sp.]